MRQRTWVALVGALLVPATVRANRPEWEFLRGRPITDVRVEPGEVFDPTKQGENHFVFEWANWVHIRTRPQVIRREYRQEVGDPFDPLLAEECERNLRALRIFQDVSLEAGDVGTGVEVVVRTTDRWSTQVFPVLRSEGGVNHIGLVLGERNILGLGFEVGGSAIYSNDNSEASVYWRDRRFLGSRWDAGADLHSDDLGRSQYFQLNHPFYSETVRWTSELNASFTDGSTRIFEAGEEVERLPISDDEYEGYLGLHSGHGRLSRVAVFYSRRHLRGSVQDDIGAAGLTFSLLHRRFAYRHFVDQIGADEEIAAGYSLQFGAGADLEALGAAADRPFWRVDAAWRSALTHDAWIGTLLRHQGFARDGKLETGRLTAETFGGWKLGSAQTFAWRLGGDAYFDDLPYLRFNLGSDDRLRGYPARELNGTRAVYGGLEERLFSRRRFMFFRMGAVAFVDVAAAWDDDEMLSMERTRIGGGIGLRFGTDPVGSNVTRVDLGFGRHSFEVALSSGAFFDVARSIGFASLSVLH